MIAQAREQLERFQPRGLSADGVPFAASSLTRALEGRIEEAVADRKRAIGLLQHLTAFPTGTRPRPGSCWRGHPLNLDDIAGAWSLLQDAEVLAHRVDDGPALQRWLSECGASVSSASKAGSAPC